MIVIHHSRYEHVLKLARAVQRGAASVDGVEAVVLRAAEFSDEMAEIEQDGPALRHSSLDLTMHAASAALSGTG